MDCEISKYKNKKDNKAVWALIWLCWLAYSCSYIGKVNYAANISQIIDFYSVSHSEAGLVSTMLFFSYGAGQFINAFLCKKYNIRLMISLSLMTSGIINLFVALTPNFEIIKYLWLLNGLSLSVLWPTVIRLLSETLSKKDMAKANVIVGTTVASGTLFIYAFSAIFASFNAFKLAFYMAAVMMPAVAIIWFVAMPKISSKARAASADCDTNTTNNQSASLADIIHKPNKKPLYLSVVVLAIIAVAVNLINDGLKTWIPSILNESYNLGESLAIILSLCLPLVAVFGNAFAILLHKKIPDFVVQCTIAFGVAGLLIATVIGGLSLNKFVLTLVCFTLVCFLISSCNSVITAIFPLFMKDKLNSGMMAGVLNGFCYLGSTLSSYGLGIVADMWGWTAVFVLLMCVCIFVCIIGLIYLCIKRFLMRRE